MLFNSYVFIFLFLPVTLLVFFSIGARGNHRVAIAFLIGASLFFYGWWNPVYLGLILASILFNYALGIYLITLEVKNLHIKKMVLTFGVAANLALLGYYKYANFFVDNLNVAIGTDYYLAPIALPLAISFFTFQQIAYLVDTYRGETHEFNFLHYCLFVTFFPQLIAGPIVHHREMLSQFARDTIYRFHSNDFAIGLSIFAVGLFKKVVIADNVALYSTPIFDAAGAGENIELAAAWTGAMAYTFQLYFDFSGYADMAIGIARMFGILLPLNFDSPYKSHNIVEFWRRWHMTLSRFLRDYVYYPLGGNRKGTKQRYINLMTTMLLGGLWHGAGWTFIAWGALHGLYLVTNNLWHAMLLTLGIRKNPHAPSFLGLWAGRLVTFLAVVVSWVFFRAESFSAALIILKGMLGLNGTHTGLDTIGQTDLFSVNWALGLLGMNLPVLWLVTISFGLLLAIVWLAPNTQDIFRHYRPALETYNYRESRRGLIAWNPTATWAMIIGTIFLISILGLHSVSEFLYFQF